MKSFLEDINDSSLTWPTDVDEDDDISFFSTSSYSSSDNDEDDDNDNGNDNGSIAAAEPFGAEVGVVAVAAVEEGQQHQQGAGTGTGTGALPQDVGMVNVDPEENVVDDAAAALPCQVVNRPGEQESEEEENNEIDMDGNDHEQQNQLLHVPAPPAPLVAGQINVNMNIENEMQMHMHMHAGTNNPIHQNLRNHQLSTTMLFCVARCEELPLIRAEIDWKLLQKQIPTYPNVQLGDELGAHLLQSILRNDPPCEVIRDIIKHYPKSCVNMDSFYAACQYASDDAVQLLMRRTMKARKIEGISWGMLAFLGDARIRIRHARFLLQCVPDALVDPMHGMFGVSPLDRMMSGAFIHGGYYEWVEKLKLALWMAKNRSLSEWGNHPFFPFHVLVKRLVSSDFMGVQFGAFSFVHSLTAFIEAEANAGSSNSIPPPLQLDEKGNLPLHIILQIVCDTNLGTTGERKLIKFLLHAYPESTMIRDCNGKLPIVLAVENGWPVYDIIAIHCPSEYTEGVSYDDNDNSHYKTKIESSNQSSSSSSSSSNTITSSHSPNKDLLIHDVLRCRFHPRFCVKGARSLVKSLLKKYPLTVGLADKEGRLPLHLAIENGWPCHDLLIAAFPSALEVKDPRTDFYPFHLAATSDMQVAEEEKSLTELGTLYELIKLGPMLLSSRCKNNQVLSNFEDNDEPKRKIFETNVCHDEPPHKRRC